MRHLLKYHVLHDILHFIYLLLTFQNRLILYGYHDIPLIFSKYSHIYYIYIYINRSRHIQMRIMN